jgi:hypothetical protein
VFFQIKQTCYRLNALALALFVLVTKHLTEPEPLGKQNPSWSEPFEG